MWGVCFECGEEGEISFDEMFQFEDDPKRWVCRECFSWDTVPHSTYFRVVFFIDFKKCTQQEQQKFISADGEGYETEEEHVYAIYDEIMASGKDIRYNPNQKSNDLLVQLTSRLDETKEEIISKLSDIEKTRGENSEFVTVENIAKVLEDEAEKKKKRNSMNSLLNQKTKIGYKDLLMTR